MAKPEKDKHLYPVGTKLKKADMTKFKTALRHAGLSHAEFLRGIILKHLKECGK